MDPLTELGPRVVIALANLFVLLAVLYSGAKHWRHTVHHATPAAFVAGLIVLMGLPSTVLLSVWPPDVPSEPGIGKLSMAFGCAAGALGALFSLVSTVFAIAVGLRLATGHPYPLLYAGPNRSRGLLLGALSGALLAVASVWAFRALGVESGLAFEMWKTLLDDPAKRPVAHGALILSVLSAALSEEILFRGVVQPWMTRGLRPLGAAAPALAIVGTSLFWAAGHLDNTTSPFIKFVQVTLLGLWLGFIARRYSVEASAAAHLALNGVSAFA